MMYKYSFIQWKINRGNELKNITITFEDVLHVLSMVMNTLQKKGSIRVILVIRCIITSS